MTFWIHAAAHFLRAVSEHQKKAAAATSATATRREKRLQSRRPERELFVDAKWERTDGAREVRLGVRGGAASLVLCDPAPNAADGWSDAVIEAPDVAKGAAFVKAIAAWLDVDVPPRPRVAGTPAPFALRWSRLEKTEDVERLALRFAWNGRAAELLVHVRADGHLVRFVEKSPTTRADLVAILAVALRDGAPA